MGHASNAQIDFMELEDPHNEFGLLDFDNCDASEHPEWQTDTDLSPEYLAKLDSDAQIQDIRINGYE